jgi:hypothetical protein
MRSIDGDFFVDVYNNLFSDDEGLLDRAHPRKHCFEINAEWERLGPFPGKGPVCGCHQRLNRLVDVMMTLEQLRALVTFTRASTPRHSSENLQSDCMARICLHTAHRDLR